MLWASYSWAQPTFDIELNQSIGNEWGLGLWGADSFTMVPIPESGEDKIWDFSFLGNEENGNGVLFSEANDLGDFFSFYSFNAPNELPTTGGGTVQDSFPNAIGCLLTDFFAFERYGSALGQTSSGEVIFYGEVEEVNGIFETEEDGSGQISPEYQFPLQLEESLVQSETTVEIDVDLNRLDSVFSYDSIIYLGYGTVKMFYGDVENVLMMRGFSENVTVSYNLTTGAFMSSGVSRSVSYDFHQSGNLLPLVSYFFSVDASGQSTFDGPSLFIPVPFFTPINNSEEQMRIPLRLNTNPNPVIDQCMVSFQLYKPGPVSLEIISTGGALVFKQDFGQLGVGDQQVSFTLPKGLPTGLYFLKTTASDGQSGIAKIMIE